MAAAERSLGALEEEVLEEVRRPGELAGLVTRAGADPEGDRHRADVRHGLGDQADAARQDRRLDQRRRERPREGRRSLPRSPRSPRSPRPLVGLGRTGTEVAEVRHQLGLEGVLEGGRRPARPAPDGRRPAPRRRGRRRVAVAACRRVGRPPARPRARRPATATPCPAGRCRRPGPRPAGPSVEHVLDVVDPLAAGSEDSFEMCSRPSRPGRTLTKAPNLVMLTTLPA